MRKYALSCLVAAMAVLAPTAALYAQEAPTLPVAAEPAEEATAAQPEAPAAPEAPAPAAEPEAPAEPATEAPSEPATEPAVADPAEDPLGTAGEIKEAVQSGQWGLAVLLSLMLLVSLLRWGAGKVEFLSFFEGKLGGYILVFTTSTGGMLLTVLGAGGSLTFATISEAVVFGFGAIGGWEAWKDIKSKKKAEA